MADLMPQQGLAAVAGEVQHAGSKGDLRAPGDGLGTHVCHGLALVELYSAQIGAEGVFHFGAHGVGQVHPAALLLFREPGRAGAQRVKGRLRRCVILQRDGGMRPLSVGGRNLDSRDVFQS